MKKISLAYVYTRACASREILSFYRNIFIYFFLSKERFRKKCPFLPKNGEEMRITSEEMAITSEEIGITSEVIAINGEGILPEKHPKNAIF